VSSSSYPQVPLLPEGYPVLTVSPGLRYLPMEVVPVIKLAAPIHCTPRSAAYQQQAMAANAQLCRCGWQTELYFVKG
jgi:hypothetical protein